MKKRIFTRLVFLLILGLNVSGLSAQDLTPWTDNPYGNEWIDYSKTYVRVGVPANGIYKIPVEPLPSAIKNPGAAHFQLWHRGKEVAIISADNDWIVFYGEKNDGTSDGLMFRPGPEARLNTHVSFYSEEGSYFLTTAANPIRVASLTGAPSNESLSLEPYHIQTAVKKYDEYAFNAAQGGMIRGAVVGQQFGASTFAETSALNNSYMGAENGWAGPTIYGPKTSVFDGNAGTWKSLTPKLLDVPINLKNWVFGSSEKPVIEAVVYGLNDGSHNINIYMSNSLADVDSKNLFDFPSFSGFDGKKAILTLSDPTPYITNAGLTYIRVKSLSNINSSDENIEDRDLFSLGYYSIIYPQSIDMSIDGSLRKLFIFNFNATDNSFSKITINNAPVNARVFDISNAYEPVEIKNGKYENNSLTVQLARTSGQSLKLVVVDPDDNSGFTPLTAMDIKSVRLTPSYENTNYSPAILNGAFNPSAYDYLIITNDNLEDGAKIYADYRASLKGGSYRYLIMNIRSIYDQFNYGEPSPLAIRRFVDFMIKENIRPKHNLLLIGHSVPYPVRVIKEMPDEVPTFGDPGSDVLLTCGLTNGPASPDIPAIPVGRINALSTTDLSNYLSKVQEYEKQTAEQSSDDLAWRKNLIHLVGAKYNYELSETVSGGFKKIFKDVSPYVTQLDGSRHIEVVSNDEFATSNVVEAIRQPAPISSIVNNGVGMIAYYGHGNQLGTIYDIQTVKLPEFTDNHKYSFIYFNGCGVGNIFTSRFSQVLSTEWLITPNKGSIAIFGNSYKSYVAPTTIYISDLYKQLFLKTDIARRTVGQVLVDLAKITISGSAGGRVMAADVYATTNIHQTNLYGDPAIRILNTTPVAPGSLPVELTSFEAELMGEKRVKLNWTSAWEKNNSHYLVERSYNAKTFTEIGRVEGKGDIQMESNYTFLDLESLAGINYYRLKQVDKLNNQSQSSGINNYSKIIAINIPDSDRFSVFPNPAVDNFSIRLNVPTSVKTWSLIDQSGRIIMKGSKTDVSIKDLQSGLYFIDIVTKDGDLYRKSIVKQ